MEWWTESIENVICFVQERPCGMRRAHVLFAIHGCIQTFHFRFLLVSFSCAKTAITATAAATASPSALSAIFVFVKVSCTRTCTKI